jgi:hypothetical protein
MNLMAVIVVFKFPMSASDDSPASHKAFSVRPTANTPSASLIPRLWVGSSFFNTALDALLRILRCLVLSFCVYIEKVSLVGPLFGVG